MRNINNEMVLSELMVLSSGLLCLTSSYRAKGLRENLTDIELETLNIAFSIVNSLIEEME